MNDKDIPQPAPEKEADILQLPTNSSADDKKDLREYREKATELEQRQMDRIKKAMDELHAFLKEEGFQLVAFAPITEAHKAVGSALVNPKVDRFLVPIGLEAITVEPEAEQ